MAPSAPSEIHERLHCRVDQDKVKRGMAV
ncbi:hypothetical protein SSE37_05902 [Sagittula stellata E-37]|uniref:Uncharacterized protein n=1 Tax=Sagittula stellata (strain ATCC 700073 / DSM 11524 / E-37) TaxID=388399 RepID=A3K9M1_SAGS3|nr:hypothetical protein SSE37_05902 [Sagittula stellata E-37]